MRWRSSKLPYREWLNGFLSGDNLELQVRVNNSVVTARRSLEKADIREGETVNVFLYRIFALRGDSVQLIENEAVRDDFVII